MDHELKELAQKTYLYGFPLVFDLEEVNKLTTVGLGATAPAAFNEFSHAHILASPQDTFVSINNDTIYSIAQVDLSVGPVVFRVPNTGDRYYVMQFVDVWTNNFAYVGTRGTGNNEGAFYLTPPGWSGVVPEGMLQIKAPTRIFSIVGRWACSGREDLSNIEKLQERTTLTPVDQDVSPRGLPEFDSSVQGPLQFFEKMRIYMHEFPPAPHFQELQKSFKRFGLLAEGLPSPLIDLNDEIKEALEEVVKNKETIFKAIIENGEEKIENGWHLSYHLFDYNRDYFEVGTINTPEWVTMNIDAIIPARAVAAYAGLWGNHGYEAAYIMTWNDVEGNTLNGCNAYELKLTEVPPVHAFWSLTMYDLPNYYLVENSINRYSIGDRTEGLIYGDDGSLTLTISKEKPLDPQVNWLPAPNGDFRPILRMYIPDEKVLSYEFHFPGIRKI